MFELLLAIFLGFASPSHTTTNNDSAATTASIDEPGPETGGDGSHIPPGRPQ
ncbi:hypothetical protein OQX61_12560 [Pedobacter sp. PLR]|uniref:hypothetical protein n=1 Tax=Pedobacter sp. PLR TaxID=2994465 RepID=UPI002247E9C4|nr:hypothetical protein [Pedobacter sp. PLR]MCX2452096.1 hypothetical protein [Pedobacter sp. PLR]